MRDRIPWHNRNTEPEQRIHRELTEKAANRLYFVIVEVASRGEIATAYRGYRAETGRDVSYFNVANQAPAEDSLHKFIKEEDIPGVLTLLELLLNELWEYSRLSSECHSGSALIELDGNIRRVFIEEGILLRLQPDQENILNYAKELEEYVTANNRTYKTQPVKEFDLYFEKISNESVIESDQAVRALGKKERWRDELGPYNEAWEQYQDGQFSYIVAEKLYNSLEAVLVKICVEKQGWNDEGDGVGSYLNSLKENGLFEPNKAMIGEWQQIVSGLQVGVQRTGGDRKRHENIDQDYCILLLHQIGSFLTFIINRYEDQYFE